MTVLVTGAGGQAGKAVIKALIKKGIDVCAMVHREGQARQMAKMGVRKTVAGDMMNPDDFRKALDGADEYKQDMMIKMFRHYNEHSFIGNARTLTSLLGRKPRALSEYFESEDC